jgi:hypothetical protein
MINTSRRAAEQLFKRPELTENSDAAKLLQFRQAQALRREEVREIELKERLAKRARAKTSAVPVFAASPSQRPQGRG